MSVLVEKIAATISGRNRKAKFDDFLSRFSPSPADKIVDVGVNDEEYSPYDNYLEKYYQYPHNITAVAQSTLTYFPAKYPAVSPVIADGLDLPFDDRSFSISYANAVIEHVGEKPAQIRFLSELRRVGARGYVTTPSRYFPIELHTRVPLLHLVLSKQMFDRFIRLIGKDWATGNYMNLLSKQELASIADSAGVRNYTIRTSKLFGFPLTYTLTW